MQNLRLVVAILAAAASPALAQHEGHGGSPVAAALPAGDPYARGLYLLHNFEYDSAAAAFRAAQAADQGNVMAYWGEAMTYNHPLWAVQDAAAARAVLARLGPDPAARRAKARSAREAQWLDAVETLYGAGTKAERDIAYHARMRAMFEADPSDIEARTFLALATLGLASQGRDTALYMRSAALLEEAFPAHPDHPGLLHYMIHSYDDPAHAPLGERAAARYAKVAPDAGHAQHMISHIYLALGRWPEVEQANIVADGVVDAQRASRGAPPTSCGHYNEWLIYALDQQGKDSRARVDECRAQAFASLAGPAGQGKLGAERNLFNNWATIAVRHGVDTGRWPDWASLPMDRAPALGRFDLVYGKLLAERGGSPADRQQLSALRDSIVAAMKTERPDDHEFARWYERAVAQIEALALVNSSQREAGLAALRAAAEAEAALPEVFGPPVLAKPSFELLGDEYLKLGRKVEAATAYRRALAAAPGRRLSVQGLAKAEAR